MIVSNKNTYGIALLALSIVTCTSLYGHTDLLTKLHVTNKECLSALNASKKVQNAVMCKLFLHGELARLEGLDDRVAAHEYTIHLLTAEVSKSRIDHHQAEIKKSHDERSRCIQGIKEFVQKPEVVRTCLGVTKQDIDAYIQQRRDERSRSRDQGDKEHQQLFGRRP